MIQHQLKKIITLKELSNKHNSFKTKSDFEK